MNENDTRHDEEIDLVELFMTLWRGKWKIVAVAVVFILSAVGILAITPSTFKAKTEIRPINSVAADGYRSFNALGFFEISPSLLLNLYIEKLEDRSAFEDAIRKFELLNRKDFESDVDYEDAIKRFASDIEILPPLNTDGSERGERRRFWTISHEYDDEEKWKSLLTGVGEHAVNSVREIVTKRFELALSVRKQERQFQVDDLETSIENAISDYERQTSDKLEFLAEQAAIARQLGVAKNTIEATTFGTQTGVIANVETNVPFYLRGYEAIEKEIALTKERGESRAFVSGLLELEQQKRALEQNKILDRAETLFKLAPVSNPDDFSPVSIKIATTDYEHDQKPILILALAAIMGGMVGAAYVLIASAMQSRRRPASAES